MVYKLFQGQEKLFSSSFFLLLQLLSLLLKDAQGSCLVVHRRTGQPGADSWLAFMDSPTTSSVHSSGCGLGCAIHPWLCSRELTSLLSAGSRGMEPGPCQPLPPVVSGSRLGHKRCCFRRQLQGREHVSQLQ